MPNGSGLGPGERAVHSVEELWREIRLLQARIKVLEQHHHSYIMDVRMTSDSLPFLRADLTSVPCWPEKPEEPPEQILRFPDDWKTPPPKLADDGTTKGET